MATLNIPAPVGFEAIASRLTSAQLAAATHPGALRVLAGAGTGKTSTLTAAVAHRVAVEGLNPERLLVVTFTKKAAAEMKGRIAAAIGSRTPSWCSNFHGLGRRQIAENPAVAGLRKGFDILDEADARKIMRRVVSVSAQDGISLKERVTLACESVADMKDNLITPDGCADFYAKRLEAAMLARDQAPDSALAEGEYANAARLLDIIPSTYKDYQDALAEGNHADFGDLLMWPTLKMLEDRQYLSHWASRFDWVACDEFQDVNQTQYYWLRCVSFSCQRVFVVGDDAQSIYEWRGSRVEFIRDFCREVGADSLSLEQNFRSTGNILAVANAIIRGANDVIPKTLFTADADGEPLGLWPCADEGDEAARVVSVIRDRISAGSAYNDIAIIYRAKHVLHAIKRRLVRECIPHVVEGGAQFWEDTDVKCALAHLKLAAHGADGEDKQGDEALALVFPALGIGFGQKALDALRVAARAAGVSMLHALKIGAVRGRNFDAARVLAEKLGRLSLDSTLTLPLRLEALLAETGYAKKIKNSECDEDERERRLENLSALKLIVGEFDTLDELFEHAEMAEELASSESAAAVHLMTIHKSKGLEFPHVILPGFEDCVYGVGNEARRLAHVAVTRGKLTVDILWTKERARARSNLPYGRSRFVGEFPPKAVNLNADADPPDELAAIAWWRPKQPPTRSIWLQ